MKKVVILGGYGDGEVVAATIFESYRQGKPIELIGFLNDSVAEGNLIAGAPVLTRLEGWSLLDSSINFITALHKVRQMKARSDRILSLGIPSERWLSIIDPSARICTINAIGVGTFIGPNVVLQPGVKVGRHVSIRAGANLGHDVVIGDYCYIGPNATLCGRSSMGNGAHLGPNSCVADGVSVGEYAVVGIASAVTKHVEPCSVVFGVPAKKIFSRSQ